MKEYTVTTERGDFTLQLDDEDAKRYDAAEVKAAPAPANKSRTAKNKSA